MVDDAWYVLLGKALSEGRGYRLISSASGELLPLYPPGLPALLSVAFRVHPQFPANVWLLKSISVAAMMGVGLLTYFHLHRQRNVENDVAMCTAAAVTVTPAFVFLATSTMMSECVFTLCQLATVVAIHQSAATTGATRWKFAALAGVLSAATMLVRSAGIAVIAAGVLWLFSRGLWRRTALFCTAAVMVAMPWLVHARLHAATPEQRAAHGGAVVYGYTDQFWMKWAGSPSFGTISAGELPARIATNVVDVSGRGIGGILMPSLFRGATESGEEVVALGGAAGLLPGSMGGAAETMVISFVLSAVVLIGYIGALRHRPSVAEFLVPVSLAITLLWPFWSFRFLLPLVPFIYFYFIRGVQAVSRGSSRAVAIVLLTVIGLNLYDHAAYIMEARRRIYPSAIQWIAYAQNVNAALGWMNHGVEGDGVLAATNPALVFLRTGRKAIAFDDPSESSESLRARRVRYVASFVPHDLPPRSRLDYKVRYAGGHLWVVELQ